jgi:hypothetical protein
MSFVALMLSTGTAFAEMSAAEKLASVLPASPGAEKLEAMMNEVIVSYGKDATESTRYRLANTLYIVHENTGVSPVDTLICMRKASALKELDSAAAFCAVSISGKK